MHGRVSIATSRFVGRALFAALSVAAGAGCLVGDDEASLDDVLARPCGKGHGPKATTCPDAGAVAAIDAAPAAPPDAAPAPPPDAAPPPPPPADCDAEVTSVTSGRHNAGKDCHGCHDGSGSAPHWYVAGTLYDSVSGTTAISGATVHVTDAAGKQLTLVTSANGNFYTGTAVSYPLEVSISRCPDNAAMSATVPSPGSCNACHDSTFRIHLP